MPPSTFFNSSRPQPKPPRHTPDQHCPQRKDQQALEGVAAFAPDCKLERSIHGLPRDTDVLVGPGRCNLLKKRPRRNSCGAPPIRGLAQGLVLVKESGANSSKCSGLSSALQLETLCHQRPCLGEGGCRGDCPARYAARAEQHYREANLEAPRASREWPRAGEYGTDSIHPRDFSVN
jgi:hypothetical protein